MIKHKMFVFGGKGAGNRKLNDLWIYDTQLSSWQQVFVKREEFMWFPE
jgi:hypothetical protein